MADAPIQCFTCSAEFSEPKELQQHVWHYQTEIATALAKLQQLLAHRGSSDRAAPDRNTVLSPEHSTIGPLQTTPRQAQAAPRAARPTTVANGRKRLRCPHRDCYSKQKGYTRSQDLVRHYTQHLEVHEFCHFCAKTFQAYNYVKHDCVKAGPDNQRKYTEMRIKALRARTKREFELRHSDQRNRQTTERLDNASVNSMSTRNTPLETPHVDETQDESSLPPKDFTASELGFGAANSLDYQCHQPTAASFPIGAGSQFPSPFQFSAARPLFSPFDSSGQVHVQFPAPLWSLWPDRMQEAQEASSSGPSYFADTVVSCQEVNGASNAPLFEP